MDSGIGENPISLEAGKKSHPACSRRAFNTLMNKNHHTPPGGPAYDYAAAAADQMNEYCAAHPGSPSDVRRPQLLFRGDLWVALLGPSVEEGIVGIGATISAALRAFDVQYLAGMPRSNERTKSRANRGRSLRATASALALAFSALMVC